LLEGGLSPWAALAIFVVAWQLMIAAMMLPSSIPMIRFFRDASIAQDRPGLALTLFVAGYCAVWGLFGWFALSGDLLLHRLVDDLALLRARPWVVPGTILLGAGLFQFSKLKDRCLEECRHPAAFLLRHYRRGLGEAFSLGRRHAFFCLGCCWALMLLMFAAGVANLSWMAALGAVMVYEKVGRHGKRLAPVVGIVLILWAALVFAQVPWLPDALSLGGR
jgi:predicted metal-binding membrane protein